VLEARAGVKHIVLLPNYMESEKMMKAALVVQLLWFEL
jgi:hypothetical protein